MTPDWFDARKAAQVVAFFASKEGGRINVLKLVKLIYLGDRENMRRYGFPVLDDSFVSMPHGPVNSMTYSSLNGATDSAGWHEFVLPVARYEVSTAQAISPDDLDELSDAEVGSLERVWDKFGHLDQWQLRDWTHDNCPEWEDPNGSSTPIPHSRVLKFLGFDDAEEREAELLRERSVNQMFATLRD